jgi:hypothetical protein
VTLAEWPENKGISRGIFFQHQAEIAVAQGIAG